MVRLAGVLGSFRSEDENEDESKFVCLVLVHVHSCP